MDKKGIVRIGTSGVVAPGPKDTFPQEYQSQSRLHYYGSLFNTLEINSSFHKLPLPATFARWAAEVPADFKFTVKLWREITHVKKLLYNLDNIDQFIKAADQLGKKKSCLLIQFPASITFEYLEQVEKILHHLHQLEVDKVWHVVVELRHVSWYNDIGYEMLNRYKASLVFHDIAASITPLDHPATSVIYYRFHGPTGNYRGSYAEAFLQGYAEEIKKWSNEGKEVFVYFNNTMGSAFQNAQYLRASVQ